MKIQFLIAQIEDPKAGDWWLTVVDSLSLLDLNLTLNEIRIMSKAVFKAEVKKVAANEALKFMNKTKAELNKVKCVQHKKLEMQKYLSSPLISTDQSKFLFHLRSPLSYHTRTGEVMRQPGALTGM